MSRDYVGPEDVTGTPPTTTPPTTTPPTTTPPTTTPPVETPPPIEPPPPVEPPPKPATPPEDEGGDGFVVEDLTEDPDALKKELKVETPQVKGPSGTVTGKVKDAATGAPMIGAYVEAIGTPFKTKTDLDGNYTLPLPPGTYELRIRYDTSESKRFSNVVVEQDKSQSINTELLPLAGGSQTVAVKAEMNRESEGARLLQRRESAAARDILSRESIAKSGGGSTASVAVRIVGATVIDGKYLFVRGLGHRYGNTLFDGARVPSPEPDLRTVPLDIFPSGSLSAINVQKTFTPDVPADFTGGSVQLESREIPKKLLFEITARMGINTQTTFRPIYHEGGFPGYDAFALGNLPRGLPKEIPKDFPAVRNGDGEWTPAELQKFGRSLYTDTRVRHGRIGPPNGQGVATLGYGFSPHDGGKLGVLVSASYRNQHQNYNELWRFYGTAQDDDGNYQLNQNPKVSYAGLKTVQNVQWSTVGLVKYEPHEDHKLSLLAFYSRDADDEVRRLDGTNDSDKNIRTTRVRYTMRSILMTRLGGVHKFEQAKGLTFDWFGSYGQARRADPSIRDMYFNRHDEAGMPAGTGPLGLASQGASDIFLDLVDHTGSGAANLTVPFKQWRQLDGKFKVGVWLEGKKRQFTVRRFTFQGNAPLGTDNVLIDKNIGGGPNDDEPLVIQETTSDYDSYRAKQQIYATYAMLDLPFVRWFKVSAGARFEANRQYVEPYDQFTGEVDTMRTTKLKDNNVLPALAFIFPVRSDMNVRLSGTETVARPEFREIAPFFFSDFAGGITVQGQPGLKTATIWNGDVRWEWFPSAEEVLAVSVFGKYFQNPIERTISPGTSNLVSTFQNAKFAYNIGAEFELRKNLEFMWKRLSQFSIGLNFAYVHSRVHLQENCNIQTDPDCDEMGSQDVGTSRVRPLQGQAPFVANAYIDYENEKSGTNVRVLYNAVLKNIAFVGGNHLPDIYLQPIHALDLVGRQRIYKGLSFLLQVNNMLNWPIRWKQGKSKQLNYQYFPGATILLGLSYEL